MAFTVQKTVPTIKIYSYIDNHCVYQFNADNVTPYMSGGNLQSYSYQKSVNNFTGTFQFAVKEAVENYNNSGSFMNKIHGLDIVVISENDIDIDFIGVVTTISFSATANGLNKIINISGKSIEFLFEYINIPLDCTAMAWTQEYINTSIANINNKLSNKGNGEGFSEPSLIKNSLLKIYDDFKQVAQTLSTLTNTKILELIEYWYGVDFIDCADQLKFQYPISSNLLTDGTVNYINYVRNLLPKNVYEFYGVIINNKPKIRIREMPFSANVWKNLPSLRINPDFLTQYTLTKSIEEVYTVFYSYIEGSAISPDFYEKLQAIEMGTNAENAVAAINMSKVNLYGYNPLKCNFVGFKNSVATETADVIKKRYKDLNILLRDWYGDLDTMYDATISVARDSAGNYQTEKFKINDPYYKLFKGSGSIGEKLKFSEGEFYITGVEHSWRYGQSIMITYHCERGGNYDSAGNYHELTNISMPYAEFN